MQIIEIFDEIVKNINPTDIIAFSYASFGAMGEKGGIYIITKNRSVYHTNFLNGNISNTTLLQICPMLEHCFFAPLGGKAPEGWVMYYIGGGNYIIIAERLSEKFIEQLHTIPDDMYYKKWRDVLLKVNAEEEDADL